MIAFLLAFLTVYGGMHVLLLRRLHLAFAPSLWSGRVLAVALVGLMLLPIIVPRFDRVGCLRIRNLLGAIGYHWMGWLFLFVAATLLVGLVGGAIATLQTLRSGQPAAWWQPRLQTTAALLVATIAFAWGALTATDLREERIEVVIAGWPTGADPLRIVQVSDLHLGLSGNEDLVEPLVARIASWSPDLVVSTGDLIDGELQDPGRVGAAWRRLSPPLGMWAVTGNHEFFIDLDRTVALTETFGFRLLRGRAVPLGDRLWLAGVDDPMGVMRGLASAADEAALLDQAGASPTLGDSASLPPGASGDPGFGRAVVLLKHPPDLDARAVDRFDLQLSGHTHGGQIWPFAWLIRFFHRFQTGLSRVGVRSLLYVSRGTGTWGPRVRFLVPPELTIIDLVPPPPSRDGRSVRR